MTSSKGWPPLPDFKGRRELRLETEWTLCDDRGVRLACDVCSVVAFRWATTPLPIGWGRHYLDLAFSGTLSGPGRVGVVLGVALRMRERMADRARVLLVDDEALIRMGMRTILDSLGYKVVGEASNGQEAIEKVRSLHPDVVIMDIKMPVLSGLDAARQLMTSQPIPVIILSAYSDRHLIEEAADAGVLAYLTKPVREADVGPAIEVARARFADLQWLRRAPGAGGPDDSDQSRIEEATRILRERHQLSEAEASKRLQHLAKNSRRTVAEIAAVIITLDVPEGNAG